MSSAGFHCGGKGQRGRGADDAELLDSEKNVGITGASILISQIDYHVYDLTWYIYIYNWYTNIDMSVFIIVMMLIWDMYTCVYIYMLSEIKCDEIMIIYWNKSWQIAEIKASSYLNIIYMCDCPGYAKKVYVIQLYTYYIMRLSYVTLFCSTLYYSIT